MRSLIRVKLVYKDTQNTRDKIKWRRRNLSKEYILYSLGIPHLGRGVS